MSIKVWGYLEEYNVEKAEIHQAIENVLKSGTLILGENVANFEKEFAIYSGVNFGVGVNSATDALFLALKAIDVQVGDEVITVSNTAVPTVSAIVATGARPVFVDIDPKSYLMDTSKLEAVITPQTKCIIPVHLFGQCVDMNSVNKVAKKYNLKVIEDCSQSHGATFESKMCGSMSDMAAYSFYPTKILGGYGDGGMVVTNNEELNQKLRRLRFYGMEKTYYAVEDGYNSRLDELHAAILLGKLKHLPVYISKRQEIAKMYDALLADTNLVLPSVEEKNEHAYYLYVCRHPKRDQIIEELKKRDIFVNISYPWPIHTMSAYAHLGYKNGDLPHTELAANEIFSLPMYPTLTHEEIKKVSGALHNILSKI